jgi:hypothetical protein
VCFFSFSLFSGIVVVVLTGDGSKKSNLMVGPYLDHHISVHLQNKTLFPFCQYDSVFAEVFGPATIFDPVNGR